MIYTRTQADVDEAIKIRKEKVQKFQELTENDIKVLERGTMTVNTLNRIEQKQEDLRGLLNGLGYWNTPIITKTWDSAELFKRSDFERILNNINILRTAFFTYESTPNTPKVSFDYKDLNDLEKILFDLDVMINDVKSKYKKCGTFKCGGGTQ